MTNRLPVRAVLLLGAAMIPGTGLAQSAEPAGGTNAASPPGQTQATTGAGGAASPTAAAAVDTTEDIIITGQTTRGRALITSSADITIATRADVDRRAPRSLSDLLELVPGIFVEGTAGEVSNNYSVRGLRGGGQRFVQLQEDGLPVVYGGGGADEFFFNDITIDRLEAVKGGSSGVLTVNGAGATINFITRKPNFDEAEGIARFTAFNYGLKRGDFYYSMPISENNAFNFGGFVQSNPGVRDNPFDYGSFQVRGAIEHRFDGGGYVRASARVQDTKSAYYADQPYAYSNGSPSGIPGLSTQFGSLNGNSFGRVATPVSTFVNPTGFREFSSTQAIHAKDYEIRLDAEKPIADGIELFAHARYLNLKWNFNGLFPGSNTGNAGLDSAVNYLTPGVSPIAGLLAQGQTAFPTATQFGIKDLTTGIITPGSNLAALNGLNGNGFLQQTTLNHAEQTGEDFGSNFGARWEYKGSGFSNNLTGGAQYFNAVRKQNQAATTTLLNDVRSNSHLYDVVALDNTNNVVGTLTDNGILSYGNWGQGQTRDKDDSISVYANDELVIGSKLHLDAGIRYEWDNAQHNDGQDPTAVDPANRIVAIVDPNAPIRNAAGVITGYNITGYQQLLQPGTAGITGQQFTYTAANGLQTVRTVGSTFGGTFNHLHALKQAYAWTVGANYQFVDNFAAYARYADGFQTNGVNPVTGVELYEAGVRFRSRYGLAASVTYFHTNFANDFYNFQDATNFAITQTFEADLKTDGVEIDATYKPVKFFEVDFEGVFQTPKVSNLRLNGVPQTSGYNGNTPDRTPKTLYTITPRVLLPDGLGEVYGRYKYVGKIFADAGNGVALPGYGVTSLGFNINVNKRISLGFDAENVFNVLGLTEGNPRQGQTQAVTSGYFYARGIVGTTYGGTITFKY